jgi:hypothetical protein
MGTAFEMAKLILEMRSPSRHTRVNRRRLERLAAQFLALAERRSAQREGLDRLGRIARQSNTPLMTM